MPSCCKKASGTRLSLGQVIPTDSDGNEADSGQVTGIFCSDIETTDRVLAERHNASERERLARMFEQAPGFITILKRPEHVFGFINGTYCRLFGDRDFVGRTARDAFPNLESQGFFKLLDQVYTTGERYIALC